MPFKNYLEPFERDKSSGTSGMGLGLYISKELFHQHKVEMKHYFIGEVFYIVLDLKAVNV